LTHRRLGKAPRAQHLNLDFIHDNLIKHGYVASPKDWSYSSVHRCVQLGWYIAEWGTSEPASIAGADYE